MIYITGASGFVGTNLTRAIQSRGFKNRTIVRSLSTTKHDSSSIKINNYDSIQDWGFLSECETLVHLGGCVPNEVNNKSSLELFDEINYRGTQKLVSDASRYGVRRFIYVSTSKVFGEFSTPECCFTNQSLVNPQSLYASSKAKGEKAIKEIAMRSGMQYFIIRPPVIYGENVGGYFLQLLRQFRRKQAVWIPALTVSRSILSVNNLCEFIVFLASNKNVPSGDYILSDQNDLSPLEIASKIAIYMEKKVNVIPFPSSMMQNICYKYFKNINLVQKLFFPFQVDASTTLMQTGFSIPRQQDEEIRKMVESYKAAPWG